MNERPTGLRCRDELAEELFALVAGRLDPGRVDAVRAHVDGCADCGARFATLTWLHDQVAERGATLFEEHVSAEELVRHAEGRPGITPDRGRRVERHLAICETCETDLRLLLEVGESLEEASEPAPGAGWWTRLREALSVSGRRTPVWAYAALAVLLVPALVTVRGWLVEGPDSGRAGIRSLPAVQRIPLGELRGTSEPPVVHLSSSGDLVLGVEVPVRETEGVSYDGRLRDASGEILWTEADLRPVDRFGTMLLIVPRDTLRPGPHELIIRERGEGPPQEFRFEFSVEVALR